MKITDEHRRRAVALAKSPFDVRYIEAVERLREGPHPVIVGPDGHAGLWTSGIDTGGYGLDPESARRRAYELLALADIAEARATTTKETQG